MQTQFTPGDKVTLSHVTEFHYSDWGLDKEEYEVLVNATQEGRVFMIECESNDGYFDIASVDGGSSLHFDAVSDYHFIPVEA